MFEKDDLREKIVTEMRKTISMDSENITVHENNYPSPQSCYLKELQNQ